MFPSGYFQPVFICWDNFIVIFSEQPLIVAAGTIRAGTVISQLLLLIGNLGEDTCFILAAIATL